jgi:glycosyltransferase involved in cell wall biosynthesis
LKSLLEDPERRRKMGEAGRRHAVECYHLESQADKLAKVLRTAAELN